MKPVTSYTVKDLKAEAKQRGISIPSGLRKQDIYNLLSKKGKEKKEKSAILKKSESTTPYNIFILIDTSFSPNSVLLLEEDEDKFRSTVKKMLGSKFGKLNIPSEKGNYQILGFERGSMKSKSKSNTKKVYVTPSEEIIDFRDDWLKGKIDNKQIEKIFGNLYPEAGTYKGDLIYDLVREFSYDLAKLSQQDLEEEGYDDISSFVMLYDLNKDEISFFPLDSGEFERADRSDDMVILYAK